MKEVPDEGIEAAVAGAGDHPHAGVSGEDGSLGNHLREVHGLDPPPTLSPSTQHGLHDRLHGRSKAADE